MASKSEVGSSYLYGYDEIMPIELGQRLRRAREAAGLSQRGVAKMLGSVTHGAVSQWESSGQISTDNLLRAANVYRADPMWLMTGQGRVPGETVAATQTCDRAIMNDAITSVLTVLQDMNRRPPPAVTARIIDLIYNRHVESGTNAPLNAQRVQDIVSSVIEYINHNAGSSPSQIIINKKGTNDQS
jgi:transcriptional regulator with XRE-family HTH domain